jgi:2-polyprenyl-6-methoxyphenol hydroxylase-like FAD-dependent oxidoreductase
MWVAQTRNASARRGSRSSRSASARAEAFNADVVIVGAGISGSVLALELARQGVDVAIVDQHAVYPPDFRCEKLSRDQIELARDLGVLDCLERAELAQRGEDDDGPAGLLDRGLRYDHMVNAIRAEWPAEVRFLEGRVRGIATGADGQRVDLETGASVGARLLVMASGPNEKLRLGLGIERKVVQARQSVCIGFSIAPQEGARFGFEAMVHQGERAGDGVAFASLFPMAGATRINLFLYLDPREPWTRAFRDDPLEALTRALPGLKPALSNARVVSPMELRATDLYQSEGYLAAGVVLIGDAFRSSCPATGMGLTRCLTDVRQLSRVHIPEWLDTHWMGADKIARFYADPVKRAVDGASSRKARMGRLTATRTGPHWRLRRWAAGRVRAWRDGRASAAGARA